MGRSITVHLSASTVAVVALLGLTWLGARVSTGALRASYIHTVTTIDALSSAMLQGSKLRDDEETGLRGYLLTGQGDFLQPYWAARQQEPALSQRLDTLAANEPRIRLALAEQRRRSDAWDRWARQVLRQTTRGPYGSRALVTQQRAGKNLFDRYCVVTTGITRILDQERQVELRASERLLAGMDWIFDALFAGAIGLGLLLGWLATRAVTRPLAALRRAARLIGQGDLTHPVMIGGAPEFIALADSMEWMRARLQAREAELVAVQEELRATVERLSALSTMREEVLAALARSKRELERSNDDLQQFAYVASHDLQEPLRTVTSYLQLLQRRYAGALDTRADDYIAYAVDGAKRMQRLIQAVLAYSRVDTHGGAFAPTDCGALVQGALTNLSARIKETGARVSYEDLPTVLGDETQLGQLFQNLIDNALKFRRDTPPEVTITAEPAGAEWVIAVRDNGIGIDPAHAERIFAMFQRLHTREEYEGTGIGLSVCKRIVERHGGRIWAEPRPGQGATFRFTLTAVVAAEKRAA